MITISQCRAARGLLDWTQQDLADASGLSKTAINNFEKGHSDIKMESLRAVRMAFESADVEFIDEDGIRRNSEKATILKGESAFETLLGDIIDSMKNKSGEVLVLNRHENTAGQTTNKALLDYRDQLKKHNISERVICENAGNNYSDPLSFRKYLPDNALQAAVTTFIYDNKVAFELWDQSLITIIHSREASDSERLRFEKLWSIAKEAAHGQDNGQISV